MDKKKIGDPVVFIDAAGVSHNALVIHVWPTSLNVAYVHEDNSDTFGNILVKETSVPFKESGMSGFYVE